MRKKRRLEIIEALTHSALADPQSGSWFHQALVVAGGDLENNPNFPSSEISEVLENLRVHESKRQPSSKCFQEE